MSDEYISITRAIAWVVWRNERVLSEGIEEIQAWSLYPPKDISPSEENRNHLKAALEENKLFAEGRYNGVGSMQRIAAAEWHALTFDPYCKVGKSGAAFLEESLSYKDDPLSFWANVRVSLPKLQTAFRGPKVSRDSNRRVYEELLSTLKAEIPKPIRGYRSKYIELVSMRLKLSSETVRRLGREAFEDYAIFHNKNKGLKPSK